MGGGARGLFTLALALALALVPRLAAPAVAPASGSVVVYGSTPAGVVAAVAAARAGAAVTLLDPAARVGGLCSGGLGHTDVGDAFAIGGLAREFFVRNARRYNASATAPLYFLEPHVAEGVFLDMLGHAGVRRVRVARVAAVAFAPGAPRIARVTTGDGDAFAADVFIDASYEGDLVTRASAANPALAYTFGREARAAYGEAWAGRREPFGRPFDFRPFSPLDAAGQLLPLMTTRISAPLGAGDAHVQGYNFRLCGVRGRASANFRPMPDPAPGTYDAAQFEALRRFAALPGIKSVNDFIGPGEVPNGKLDINNGCLISTDVTGAQWAFPNASYAARDALVAAHKAYTIAFFYTLRTDAAIPASIRESAADLGLCADEFASNDGFPEQLYVREAVRLVGDRVLIQSDLWPPTDFGNTSIGLGSYAADGHYATRGPCIAVAGGARCDMVTSEADLAAAAANGTLWTGGEGYVGSTSAFALYQIPAWALWGARAGAENLLSPTAPSASHVTFASLRVEPTYMVMGHAAGDIAALAAASGGAVMDVDVGALHARLKAEGAVLCKEC